MSKNNEVAVAGQFNQSDVPNLLAQVVEQIATLKGSGKKEKNTAGITVPGFFNTLDNIEDLSVLIKIDAMISAKAKAYKASAKALGIHTDDTPEFTVEGVVPAKWRSDIKMRYAEVAHKSDCLLYTSDAADDMQCVDLGGRRIIKKNF